MAADSSIDETEAAGAAAEEKPAALPDKPNGPPRPPRPARRASVSLRIPLPSAVIPGSKLSSSRAEPLAEQQEAPAAAGAAEPSTGAEAAAEPARTMPSPGMPPRREQPAALRLDPQNMPTPLPERPSPPPAPLTPRVNAGDASNIEFSLTRRSSGAPPLSFDSEDVDPSDRAPVAPLTPWHDVPPLQEAADQASPAVAAAADNDHEDTIVGQVPQDLLELASENEEENTRAYQAPQELIDLARRKREERRQARGLAARGQDAKGRFADSLPPAARAVAELDEDQSEVATATVPLDTLPPGDAAPPVARSSAVRGGALRDEQSLERQVSNAPASLEELVAAVSRPGERESIAVTSQVLSEDRTPDSLPDFARGSTRARGWLLLVGLVLLLGFVLARWGGMELPLSR